jgi:hypothetical protein
VDADGTSLPTSYEVLGESLVQHVDTTGATYPVVADPNLTFGLWNSAYGPGVYLNLTGFEIKAYASVIIAAGGAALLATCVLAKVPVQIRSLLQLLCGAVGTPTIGTVLGTIQAANGNSSYKNNTCYQTLLASSHPFVKTARDQCTFGNV